MREEIGIWRVPRNRDFVILYNVVIIHEPRLCTYVNRREAGLNLLWLFDGVVKCNYLEYTQGSIPAFIRISTPCPNSSSPFCLFFRWLNLIQNFNFASIWWITKQETGADIHWCLKPKSVIVFFFFLQMEEKKVQFFAQGDWVHYHVRLQQLRPNTLKMGIAFFFVNMLIRNWTTFAVLYLGIDFSSSDYIFTQTQKWPSWNMIYAYPHF